MNAPIEARDKKMGRKKSLQVVKERRELDTNEVWLSDSEWYLNLTDYTLTHDGEGFATTYSVSPTVLFKTALLLKDGDSTPEGCQIDRPTVTWYEIARHLRLDPSFRFEFTTNPIKFEEFIAGAYKLQGWDKVFLTPRSADMGRDIIAITSRMCAIRVLDQAKAYRPTNLVTQNDVRAMFGVLRLDHSATKGIITTTSDFAPGVADEFGKVIPYQLETKNGEQFLEWVKQILVAKPQIHRIQSKRIDPPPDICQPAIVPRSWKSDHS